MNQAEKNEILPVIWLCMKIIFKLLIIVLGIIGLIKYTFLTFS